MLREILKHEIVEAVKKLFDKEVDFGVFCGDKHADYSSNAAMVLGNPKETADKIKEELLKSETVHNYCSKIEIAGQGFLNFFIKDNVFIKNIGDILKAKEKYGSNNSLEGKKIMIEYTDPNPFKEFHIGHLMSNTIGESIARLFEAQAAIVKRACWQGDVGLHVARAIWGKLQKPEMGWGEAYVYGTLNYENNKEEIEGINKKIFLRSDEEINELYKKGREESLEHFEEIYKILGTKFDYYFFEGKEGIDGKPIVEEFLKKGIFEESDGAIVFRGEKYGLHTRVFINSQGLPTYEAKELGLNKAKFDKESELEQSIIVTANEQSDYFKVVLKTMEQIFPDIAKKTKHIAHGILRFASGKMSSRKGNVITGESLIERVKKLAFGKIKERDFSKQEKEKIAEVAAVGAIKYSILKQAIGGDIVYDFDKSISFEGDSGPYLQYAYVRAKAVLKIAREKGIEKTTSAENIEITEVEKILYQFPEIVEDAREKYAPNYICAYLVSLAHAFNSYYEKFKIISNETESSYRISLTEAVAITLKNGLHLLGISAPEKM